MMIPTAVISQRGEERLRSGHPWIYRSDVVDVAAAAGEVVDVVGPRHRALGRALFSDQSQITLRMLTRDDEDIDAAFWQRRLSAAVAFRSSLGIDATAYRLIHGEADLLPSLVVDRYGDVLVVQALSQGMDRQLSSLIPMLVELTGAQGVLARHDARPRELEGLESNVVVLHGEVPERVSVTEGSIRYDVELRTAQKTGLFLDQRENRAAAANYACGRLLDGFSYHGGFALQLASRCERIEALDISADAVAQITENARQNGFAHIEAREANVFDALREYEHAGTRFDTIVLDPPAFAKRKDAVARALAGYKDINLRALRLLDPGGFLITCSCSYHISEALFAEMLYDASLDSGVQVTVVDKRMQGRDHPVLLGVPETYYLKCLILRRIN